jgi:hypothetical protein
MPKPKARPAKRSRGSSVWRFVKILVALASIPTLILAGFLIHYYYVFDRWIDQKLGKGYEVAETEIYSAPQIIQPGKPISQSDFVTRLRRLGYVDQTAAPDPKVASFQYDEKNRVRVTNDLSLDEDAGRAVQVSWFGNRIRDIVEVSSGQNLEQFALRPERISNIINKSREKRAPSSTRTSPNTSSMRCWQRRTAGFSATAASTRFES